ncbi:CDP-alcohol phosphatidyltransferase family protein [Phenylobacterium sp.]|uniref:CDP-alcohol phosphatidyltransferase family protein n=1 Tax=Phenylobacterium sp. TaxID=1871053 RepID=UPI0028124887|nr:CDP-alcohol phosphatidyltransferase family protein [Phenylobacterium sp.]
MIANVVTSLRIVLLAPLYVLLTGGEGDASRWWALAVFLAAGFTDVVDGFLARRFNQVSVFGAMLDLIADRLLTAVTLVALMAGGVLADWTVLPALVLIVRDLVVASLNEALPGRLSIRVSMLERVKIACHFLAIGLLLAPAFFSLRGLGQHDLGRLLLALAATLAVVTLADYVGRAILAFRDTA